MALAPQARWLVVTLVTMGAVAGIAACGGGSGDVAIPDSSPAPAATSPASSTPGPKTDTGPTFHKDVQPILEEHCQKCHTSGGLAPFPLLTYADAKIRSAAMVAETAAKRMPPWGAQDTAECKPRLPWAHDERLSAAQIKLLADWTAAGTPEGDSKDAPAPKAAPSLDLQGVTDTLVPKTAFAASGDHDQFRCFVLDNPYPNGVFLTGVHVVPGNPKVVHHAVVFPAPTGAVAAKAGPDGSFECSGAAMALDGNGQSNGQQSITLDVWTPGVMPVELPSNIAIPIVAGSKLIMQIHYSPGGMQADPDLTKVLLRSSAKTPEYFLFTTAVGNAPAQLPSGDGLLPMPDDPTSTPVFVIPKNEHAHVEKMQFTMPAKDPAAAAQTIWIYGVMGHAHLAGIDVKVDLARGTDSQCLLQDQWDFHWQRMYTYDAAVEKLPTLEPGDKISLRCTYDNSLTNRRLGPELVRRGLTPTDIHLGEQTLDEMCLVIPQLLVKAPTQ